MKNYIIAIGLAAASLSGLTLAASNSQLKIVGSFTPTGCSIDLNGGQVVTLDDVKSKDLRNGIVAINEPFFMSIDCNADKMLTILVTTPNQFANNTDASNFISSEGDIVGNYVIKFDGPRSSASNSSGEFQASNILTTTSDNSSVNISSIYQNLGMNRNVPFTINSTNSSIKTLYLGLRITGGLAQQVAIDKPASFDFSGSNTFNLNYI